jgi:diguanylate cyclase
MLAAGARRRGEEITVCFVDIDGLKQANDQHGHEFGDEVIRTVAQAVRGSVREGDLVARWGGDEFLVVGPYPGPDVQALEARIDRRIAESGLGRGRWEGAVTVGYTSGDLDVAGFDALVTQADEAMYESRRIRRDADENRTPQI